MYATTTSLICQVFYLIDHSMLNQTRPLFNSQIHLCPRGHVRFPNTLTGYLYLIEPTKNPITVDSYMAIQSVLYHNQYFYMEFILPWPPEFKYRHRCVLGVFNFLLRPTTIGGRSARFAYHEHKIAVNQQQTATN